MAFLVVLWPLYWVHCRATLQEAVDVHVPTAAPCCMGLNARAHQAAYMCMQVLCSHVLP